MEVSIWQGIIVGAVGGACAGLTVALISWAARWVGEYWDRRSIYAWLEQEKNRGGQAFRSTRTIASWNNLTEDRVRHLCSQDERIFLSTGEREDMWSIESREQSPNIRPI